MAESILDTGTGHPVGRFFPRHLHGHGRFGRLSRPGAGAAFPAGSAGRATWASFAVNTLLLRIPDPDRGRRPGHDRRGKRGWGLLNALALPTWLAVVLAIVLLDLAIYLQHVMFHAVPALWRLHRMHHADLDFDVTTGARFHPIEILLSMVLEAGRHRGARRAGIGRAGLRGAAERHLHV